MSFLFKIFVILLVAHISSASLVNSTDNSSVLAGVCTSAPQWKLNMCNLTCATCTTTDVDKCQTCQTGLTLSKNYCQVESNPDIYYFTSLLSTNPLVMTQVQKFKSGITSQPFSTSSVVRICYTSLYNFEMLGLFSNTDSVTMSLTFSETISNILVKLNYLTTQTGTKFTLQYSGDDYSQSYEQTFNKQITGSYYKSTEPNEVNYLTIPSLNADNVRSIIQIVQLSFSGNTKTLTLQIASRAKDADKFWGFSDLTIISKQCNTCVTTELSSTISNIGYFTLYVFIVTVPLLCLFIIFVKIGAYRKELKLNNKYLDSDSHHDTQIPVKGINRIIRHLNPQYRKQEQLQLTLNRNTSLIARLASTNQIKKQQ